MADRLLLERFEAVVAAYPERTAVAARDRRMSYAELDRRAELVAARLRGTGAGPNVPVAVTVEKADAAMVIATVAIWKAGAVYMPIPVGTPAALARQMVRNARPVAVVSTADVAGVSEGWDLPIVLVDTSAPDVEVAPTRMPRSAGHLAYVIHTSGTTGRPKAVAVTHGALATVCAGWRVSYRFDARPQVALQAAGPAFDVHVADMARSLGYGNTLVLCATDTLLDPPALYELIESERIDSVEVTPTVMSLLLNWFEQTGATFSTLRLVIVGGEAWSPAELRRLRSVLPAHARVLNTYGVAEAAIDSTWYETVDADADTNVLPIGRPLPEVRTAVLDGRLMPVPSGEVGELYLAGPSLAEGYLNDPARTAERFLPATFGPPGDRMYRTGDLVRQRPNGVLEFVGRVDDEVKIRGVRVRLGAVEAVLAGHPDVRVAVVLQQRRGDESVLVGYLVSRSPADVAGLPERVRGHASSLLPAAMVPAQLVVLERLPRTRAGKVDRAALADCEPVLPQPTRAVGRTGTEAILADVWIRLLGRPPAGVDEDFFAAGGTSLTAATLAIHAGRECGVRLSARHVLGAPTVAGLAELVAELSEDERVCPPEPATGARLAPGQRGLWVLHTLRPEDPTYHVATVLRIRGPLAVDRLRTALDALVARHDALRIRIAAGPELLVEPPMPMPFETDHDVDEAMRRPFDLARAPLIRAALIQDAEDIRLLVITAHHIVFDGWSERVMLRELGELYAGKSLPPAPSYAAMAATAWPGEQEEAEQRRYWRRRLADPPPHPSLPSAAGGGSGRACVTLPAALREVGRAHHATPFMVVVSVLAVLLARWSGQRDLVIGFPFGDRDSAVTQDLIGFVVRTLPLRFHIDPEESFATLLARTRQMVTEALTHCDVPFEQIVRDLGMGGDTRNPLFRVWCNMLGTPPEPPLMPGLGVEVVPALPLEALFDLVFYITDEAGGYRLDAVCDPGVIDDPHLAEFLSQAELLCDAVCANAQTHLARHPLRTPRAAAALADPAADLTRPVPDLVAGLAEVAARWPDRMAMPATTYREVYARAGALARRLVEAGVGRGDVVPIYAVRAPELVVALLGVLGAGAAFAVLDHAHPPRRLAAQLTAAGTGGVGVAVAGTVPAELRALCPGWLEVPDQERGRWPAAVPSPDDLAYVAFTSGTSGDPEGVCGTAVPVAHFLTWYTRQFELGGTDRFAVLSGLSHDPLLRDVLTPLWLGGTACVPPERLLRAPAELLDWLSLSAVTVLHVTPALCRLITAGATGGQLPGVRLVCSSGDMLYDDDLAGIRTWAPNARIINGYGTTETPQLAGWHEGAGSIGSGVPGTQLLVVNPAGDPAGVGELGELVVRSPYLARDLLARANRLSEDPVTGHRRFATGDLGRHRPDGSVAIVGRADEQVQVRGFRVELAEIDRWLREDPAVTAAASAMADGPEGEPWVVGYVTGDPDEQVLRSALRRWLPEHMVPRRIVAVPAIPLTPNGKPDRARLVREVGLPAPATAGPDAPLAPLEETLLDVWRQLLGRDAVGADKNFFDLGADSILIVRVHKAIELAIGRELPITALFEFTTIRSLAGWLARSGPASTSPPSGLRADAARDLRDRRLAARRAVHTKEMRP